MGERREQCLVEALVTEAAVDGEDGPASNRWSYSDGPGVGPITSTAIAATVPDARMFRSGREFAAWLG